MDWMEQEQERGITITSAATTCFVARPPASTSSTPPATSTSRSRSSARCACSTAPSRCSTARPASSPSPRRCGGRPTSTTSRASASSTRWTASAPDFYRMRRHDHRAPRRRRRCRHPAADRAPRADFKGVIDLVAHDARSPGAATPRRARTYDDRRHPGRPWPSRPTSGATSCSRRSPRPTTTLMEKYLERRGAHAEEIKAAHPPGDHRRRDQPGALRLGVQEQGRAAHARRRHRLPAVARSTSPPVEGHEVGDEDDDRRAQARRPTSRSPRWRSRSQRPALRQADLRPGLLRQARDRARRCSTRPRASKERIGKIFQMHANKREDDRRGAAPATSSPSSASRTPPPATRCATRRTRSILESMTFPEPVISVAIEPKTKGDQEKLGTAIQRLAEEDPTFQVRTDEETGQTIIAGMGELHLEILVDRMRREFKVEANVGKPQVAYRETIRKARSRRYDYTHKKQTGGSGQYAKVQIDHRAARRRGRRGYEFVNKVTGGRIPREYIPSVDAGVQEAMQYGVAGRLPAGRRQGDAARRCLPRGRLLRDGVQDRRLDGVQGGGPQGRPGAARADDGRRGDHARGLHGRRHRRPQLPPRADPGHGGARRRPRRHARWSRCRRCSATSATCGARRRAGPSYSMQFDSYAEVPRNVAEEIIKKARGE